MDLLVNITISVDQYRSKQTGPKISVSRNKEIEKFCNTSKETIDKIIEGKIQRQQDLETMTENAFWELFTDPVKENLITCDNLFQKKIDNLIMNNEYTQNTTVYDIIKKVKNIEFGEKEIDLKLFYEGFQKVIEEDKKANLSKYSNGSTRRETNIYDNDDYENEEIEKEEKPFRKQKRKRTKKLDTKEELNLDLSQLEVDNNFKMGIPKVNEVFKTNKQKLYLNRRIYKNLYKSEINQISFGDLWDMIDKDENNEFILSKDDLDKVLRLLREENKIKYVDTDIISLIK